VTPWDPNEYMRIFYANRDKLRDPDTVGCHYFWPSIGQLNS